MHAFIDDVVGGGGNDVVGIVNVDDNKAAVLMNDDAILLAQQLGTHRGHRLCVEIRDAAPIHGHAFRFQTHGHQCLGEKHGRRWKGRCCQGSLGVSRARQTPV